MKITKIYSNYPKIFNPVCFNAGINATATDSDLLNIVLAEFKDINNYKQTSHNLGKTKLLELLDFLLLKDIDKKHFLNINQNLFSDFTFYLEILLNSGSYLTIRRAVSEPTKISLKKHSSPYQDFADLPDSDFDFSKVGLDKATLLVDTELNLTDIAPYSYRNGLSYFIRTQDDYKDLFQMAKFIGQHKFWKPYLWKIFGFNNETMRQKYDLEEKIKKLVLEKEALEREAGEETDINTLKNVINAKKIELDIIEKELDSFNFSDEEKRINQELLYGIEVQISKINERLYSIEYDLKKSRDSLEQEASFNLKNIEKIYQEVGIIFPDTIIKSYKELIAFNKKITAERNAFLKENIDVLESEKRTVSQEKAKLNSQRIEKTKILSSSDSLDKYKNIQKNFTTKKAFLIQLENAYSSLIEAGKLDVKIKAEQKKLALLIQELEENTKKHSETCAKITNEFTELLKRVWDTTGVIKIYKNREDNIDFEIQTYKEVNGRLLKTNEADGHTCKKVLCALFDLAVLRTYADKNFFKFVYHDGVMENLEPKKREMLFNVIRETCDEFKIQYIFSLMECDKVSRNEKGELHFEDKEVIVRLDDSGEQGRLFKMQTF